MQEYFSDCAGALVTDAGGWYPVIDSGTISTANAPITAEFVSALGERTAFFRGREPRTWSVTGTGSWEQVQAINRLALLPQQVFYWVSPLGRHTNILYSDTPRYGTLLGERNIGGLPIALYGPNQYGNNTSWAAPVQEGMRVVASAYQQGGRLRVSWRTPTGESIVGRTVYAPTGDVELVTIDTVAPAGASGVELIALGVERFGSPAVRIGHDATKFSPGATGCANVTLHDVETSHGNIAYASSRFNISFTLKEVT